jgi:ubiquinone/menaquinone biosynthesis C-methylase UbiE
MDSTAADVWKLAPVAEQFLSIRADIPLAQEQIGIMLAILASRGEPVARFLDLGCGDGILAAAVLGRYPESHGILIDFSEPMLAQASERLCDFTSRLRFLNVDYADPMWVRSVQSEAPFDAIVSGYSIHHQPDARKREIYAETYDLLQPGGWFVNVEHVAPATKLATDLFENHIIDAKVALEVRTGGSRTRAQITEAFNSRADKAANILAPVEIQCDWLRDLGYEDVDCYFRIYSLAVFAGRRSQ